MSTSIRPSSPQQPSAPTPASPARNENRGPTREQIARRAYEIFLERGGQHGHAEDDWAQAERELRLGRQ